MFDEKNGKKEKIKFEDAINWRAFDPLKNRASIRIKNKSSHLVVVVPVFPDVKNGRKIKKKKEGSFSFARGSGERVKTR